MTALGWMPSVCFCAGKKSGHSRHGYTRIRHTNDDFFRRSKIVINQYRRGRTLLCRGKVGLFLGKREIASLGVIGRREAGQLDRTVAEDFSAEVLRDLVRRKGNKGMGKCHKLLRRRKTRFPLESEIVGPLSTYRSHRMANIPSLPGELPFPLGLLAFGSGVMLTAPNLAPKDSELVRREISGDQGSSSVSIRGRAPAQAGKGRFGAGSGSPGQGVVRKTRTIAGSSSLNFELRSRIDPNFGLTFVHLDSASDPDVLPFDPVKQSRVFDGVRNSVSNR